MVSLKMASFSFLNCPSTFRLVSVSSSSASSMISKTSRRSPCDTKSPLHYHTHKNGIPYLPVLDLQKTGNSLLLKLDKLHYTNYITLRYTNYSYSYNYATLHYTTLDYTTLPYITLHYTATATPLHYNYNYSCTDHTTSSSCGWSDRPGDHRNHCNHSQNTTPTSFRSINGFALPSVVHNN